MEHRLQPVGFPKKAPAEAGAPLKVLMCKARMEVMCRREAPRNELREAPAPLRGDIAAAGRQYQTLKRNRMTSPSSTT
jgi:hypothetical protein